MPFKNLFRKKQPRAAPLSPAAQKKRRQRRMFLAAALAAVGVTAATKVLRRKPVAPEPPRISAQALEPHIGGKKWNKQLSAREREYWAREWAEAFNPKSNPTDRLPGLAGANHKLLEALSEAQLQYNFERGLAGENILHPRTVRRFIDDARALAAYSVRAGGNKYFFLNRMLERTWSAHDRQTIEYFKLLYRLNPDAVDEIYSLVGVR